MDYVPLSRRGLPLQLYPASRVLPASVAATTKKLVRRGFAEWTTRRFGEEIDVINRLLGGG
jgi:hypothetical protein